MDGSNICSGDALVLPKALDLREAAPLAARLLSCRGEQLRLDASNVKKIGVQCIQVIVSAYLTWERDGVTLSLVEPSREFREAFATVGLDISKFTEKEVTK